MKKKTKKKSSRKNRFYNNKYLWKNNFIKVPYEAAIKPIFRLFIEPVMRAIEAPDDGMSQAQRLRIFFGTSDRHVGCFKVLTPFDLKGKVYDAYVGQFTNVRTPYFIEEGFQFYVRFDDEKPGIVEAESDELNEIFTLTEEEWNAIKGNLKYVG